VTLVLLLGVVVFDLETIELDVVGFFMLARTIVLELFLSFVWVRILSFGLGIGGVIFLSGMLVTWEEEV
jgi:hypothetical protein